MALTNVPIEIFARDLFVTSIPHAVNLSAQFFDLGMRIPEMHRNIRACDLCITGPWAPLPNPSAKR